MTAPIKWGSEIPVNTTTFGTQDQPKIAALAGGRFVAAWRDISATGGDTSSQAVRAQIFNADGSKYGSEFLVNTTTTDEQWNPAVIALPNDGFVITWQDNSKTGGDTSQSAIRAQMYDPAGGKIGAEFLVNTTTGQAQNAPAGAAFPNGKFVISWTDFSGVGDTVPAGIRAQMFNANGSKFGAEMLLNSTTAGNQVSPTITTLANGYFAAAWVDSSKTGADTSSSAIRARVFDGNGTPLAADFVVNTTTEGEQLAPHVTGLAGGRFVVSWTDFSKTGADKAGYAVRAQVFNSDGSRSGSEFLVNTTTANDQLTSVITPLPDGRFVAAWLNVVAGHAEVKAQVFNYNGSKAGDEFTANTGDFTYLNPPSITTLPDGRFVVSFMRESDTSGTGISAQIFDPREGPVFLTGTAIDNQYVGTPHTDVMYGGAGVDRLMGEGGNDTLQGGPGADILNGGAGSDTASYADSPQRVLVDLVAGLGASGDAKDDKLSNIENLLGSIHNDVLLGDDNDNALSGVGGKDGLKGGGGSDLLVGGLGDDSLDGGSGDDTAVFAGNFREYSIYSLDYFYTITGPDGSDTVGGVEHLVFNDGRIDAADGSVLFDSVYYMAHNHDVFYGGVNALDHYNVHGWREGRDPNPLFDTSGYLAVNKDVAAAGLNPLDHYHSVGWHEGRDPSAWFDTTLYLRRNPDVAAAGVDPLEHYIAYGRFEGRAIHDAIGAITAGGFDAQHYLFENPDVAAAGVDPLTHFNTFGWREGRNPNAWFDTSGYLSHYADVAASGVNPLQHYMEFGWREGRDPSLDFDTLKYFAANPDVYAANVNPLEHFLLFGAYEGRNAQSDALWH
jgi:Ca2+-binding RTX toxin-like protein